MIIAVALGTRPEVIKCASTIHALIERGQDVRILHTGQHYDERLDAAFFSDLGLPAPTENLRIGSMQSTRQIAKILEGAGEVLQRWKPDWVVVQGDTNSVLACGLAALKLGLPVAHVEAGLRSDDWSMPEESNRVLTDRLSSLLLCPGPLQVARLSQEGIRRNVHVVGNTVVDAVLLMQRRSAEHSTILSRCGLSDAFFLLTLHRPSNVDDPARLRSLLHAIAEAARTLGRKVVWPIHPRTEHTLRAAALDDVLREAPWVATPALGYVDFQHLLANAELVLTDSGGVQEEACTLRVPCITLRPNTERPETLDVGANVLCPDPSASTLTLAIGDALARPRDWSNPFGDGLAGVRCAELLIDPGTRRLPAAAP